MADKRPLDKNFGESQFERRIYSRAEFDAYIQQFRNWEKWGTDDELGSANFVTPETIAAAARLIQRGAAYSLAIPLDRLGPQRGSTLRSNPQHVMLRVPHDPIEYESDGQHLADDAIYTPLQASTQWDAFAHFFHDGFTYNGRDYDSVTASNGAIHNSITNLSANALGRGVLLDIPRHVGRPWLEPGEAIQAEHLEACAEAQGVEVGEGDFVLVRTGHLERRMAEGDWGDYAGGPAPGLGLSTAEFLAPRHVVAVATDTWGAEAMPFETPGIVCPLHAALLVNAGIYIGEIWDLADLAADCAEHQVYEFFLSAPPLMITGAVGSPLNPIAVL
jgi:kynurenine formamidase